MWVRKFAQAKELNGSLSELFFSRIPKYQFRILIVSGSSGGTSARVAQTMPV
jgi:hypothetical protein